MVIGEASLTLYIVLGFSGGGAAVAVVAASYGSRNVTTSSYNPVKL